MPQDKEIADREDEERIEDDPEAYDQCGARYAHFKAPFDEGPHRDQKRVEEDTLDVL